MKKSVVVGLFVGLIGILCSFNSPETFVKTSGVPVSVSDTLVDSTKLCNHYLVYYKKGYTQSHTIPVSWDINKWAENKNLGRIVKVDTLEVNINCESGN
jgi:hypothetical protein